MRSAISSTRRSWSKPDPPGSKISTVALCIGVVGDSAARIARSRGRSRSLMWCPLVGDVVPHGILADMRLSAVAVPLVLVLAASLAACGGDDDADPPTGSQDVTTQD